MNNFLKSVFYGDDDDDRGQRKQSQPHESSSQEKVQSADVSWVTKELPQEEAVKHFLVCGTVGSGKSTIIQLFLQSIIHRFKPEHHTPEQLIAFDAKGDLIPRLRALGLPPEDARVYILNPFHKQAAYWNLGEAITTPAMARYLATLLIPEETGTTAPYFPNTAREIVFWVALCLSNNKKRKAKGWSLRDLMNSVDSKENIAAITAQMPRAAKVVGQHLNDTKHFPGVLSTLATKLGKFEEVAALWEKEKEKKRPFSVKEFLEKRGVLILGHDPVLQESIWPMNAIILQALTNEILRGGETTVPRHWFVLDEFRAMGKVQCIRDLLNLGRSKGASVLLGIQSMEGVMEKYEEKATNDILGLCSTKTFLRAGGPFTAEWAERHFNKVRHIEQTITETSGVTSSTSVQHQLQERSMFLPSMFLDLPFPVSGGPFMAISDIPCLRTTVITERPFNDLLAMMTKPQGRPTDDEDISLRDNFSAQIIDGWSPTEMAEFCDMLPPKTGSTLVTKEEQQQRRRRRSSDN